MGPTKARRRALGPHYFALNLWRGDIEPTMTALARWFLAFVFVSAVSVAFASACAEASSDGIEAHVGGGGQGSSAAQGGLGNAGEHTEGGTGGTGAGPVAEAGAPDDAGNAGEGGVGPACTTSPVRALSKATRGLEPVRPPAYLKRSADFSLKVNGVPVDVIGDLGELDYAHFSIWGQAATIEVTAIGLPSIASFTISPLKRNIVGKVATNKLTYAIPVDQYTIVNIAGKSKKLIVLADPKLDEPPASGAGVYNVVSGYRADATGMTWSTKMIQAAIDAATATGSSCARSLVYVPAGTYKISNLYLKSNIELFMAPGSAFWFSNVQADYRLDWTTKGNGTRWISTEAGVHNLRIFGRGTIDGNALQRKAFYNNLLVLNASDHVTVDGIVLRNGSKWGTMIVQSNDVLFNNVKFLQGFGPGEDDGVDVIESQNVTIKYSISVSGDDPYSVKSYAVGGNYVIPETDAPHEITQDVVFDNVIAWTGCHAFKVGQGVGQIQDGITFKNSVVFDAAHAISLHHKQGSAVSRNITWDNIDIEHIDSSNIGQSWAFVQIEDAGSGIGPVQNLNIRNINVRDAGSGVSNADIPGSKLAAGMGPLIGLDASNRVHGVFFSNVKVLGVLATTPAEARVQANGFVDNLQVGTGYNAQVFYDADANLAETDWSSSNFKGDCGLGWAVTGLSAVSTAPGSAHALRCKNYGVPFNGEQAGAPLLVSATASHVRAPHAVDWDPGFAVTECGTNEYVSGISQDNVTHVLSAVRCAQAPTKATGCKVRSVLKEDRGEASGDWDPSHFKGECAVDQVVVGLSVNASGNPRSILCCPR